MNKQKKPAVVAKTAKKRGRPAGVKNKPKTLDDVKIGQKISFDQFNRLLEATPPKVNWEKLAKDLQAALASEIRENDIAKCVIEDFRQQLNRKRTFWERLVCLATGVV